MKSDQIQDIYDLKMDKDNISKTMDDVKTIIYNISISDLEKLQQLHDAVFQYERKHLETLKYTLKEK